MVVEGFMLVVGALGTLALGTPVAVALSRPHRWRSKKRSEAILREPLDINAGFTPLDFGPDLMRWPSSHPWPATHDSPLEWPSKHWDDEHFGSHWRDGRMVDVVDSGFHAMAGRDPLAGARDWYETDANRQHGLQQTAAHKQAMAAQDQGRKDQRAASSGAPTPRRAPQRVRERLAEREQGVPVRQQQQQRQRRQQRQEPQQQPHPQQAAPPASAGPQPQVQAPTKAELEQLVVQVGLAGTVQQIMQRTGWDFRKAAHYLAKMRQG